MIETKLFEFLKAKVEAVDSRVFGVVQPQNQVFPSITFRKISADRRYHHTAQSLCTTRFQIDCWARTYLEVNQVADRVRRELSGFQGDMEGLDIQGSFIVNEQDGWEIDTELYRAIMDVEMSYIEEIDEEEEEGGD